MDEHHGVELVASHGVALRVLLEVKGDLVVLGDLEGDEVIVLVQDTTGEDVSAWNVHGTSLVYEKASCGDSEVEWEFFVETGAREWQPHHRREPKQQGRAPFLPLSFCILLSFLVSSRFLSRPFPLLSRERAATVLQKESRT